MSGLAVSVLVTIAHELMLFAGVGMLIGGLDDLLVDLLWLSRERHRRRTIFRQYVRTTMATLPLASAPGRIAIFVPAWQEADVIGQMLHTALGRWRHADYRIYVGTYPNDPATAAAVSAVGDSRVRVVGGIRPGPTSKAECLNRCWHALLRDEAAEGVQAKAIVLHDAEDVVHPDELMLYDRMIERFDLVQIPVFPLPAHGLTRQARLVAAIYCDEFAVAHSYQLSLREAVGASVPSAGVGCAIRRSMLARLAAAGGGDPFDEDSLTEDYEVGLRIVAHGGNSAFVTIPAKPGALPVAVRAHFPETFTTAIRQKARWVTGIAFAGWDRLRWDGGFAERWMRLRDRRAPVAALVLFASYAVFLLALVCGFMGAHVPLSGAMRALLSANAVLLVWRLLMRAGVVARIYGRSAGYWSIPRVIAGNIIAIGAAARALWHYAPGKRPKWDKTAHVFPEGVACD